VSACQPDRGRFELLRIPGIQDVVFERHAGSFTCYVYAITPQASSSVMTMVQETLNEHVSFPTAAVAVSPDLVGITLSATIRLSTSASSAERETILSRARSEAEGYINNLRTGEPLIINEIADRIRNADARILDVGEPNRQLPEIVIWRSRGDGTRYGRFLVANYTPATGERVVAYTY
jgi:hypothetical protein